MVKVFEGDGAAGVPARAMVAGRARVARAGAPAALPAAILRTVSDGNKSPEMEGVPYSAVPGCIPGRMTQVQRCTAGETASLVIRYPV